MSIRAAKQEIGHEEPETARARGKKASVTTWTEVRLNRLFKRYNRLYWKGRLRGWAVAIEKCEDAYGLCFMRGQRITIDVDAHPSDRELRATLLHEMAHAAAGQRGLGHGTAFFAQLERLLRARAPITIRNPEAGGLSFSKVSCQHDSRC